MYKALLSIIFCLFVSSAWAANPQCPTRPAGDATNACASTAFVKNTIFGLLPISGGTMTGPINMGGYNISDVGSLGVTVTMTFPDGSTWSSSGLTTNSTVAGNPTFSGSPAFSELSVSGSGIAPVFAYDSGELFDGNLSSLNGSDWVMTWTYTGTGPPAYGSTDCIALDGNGNASDSGGLCALLNVADQTLSGGANVTVYANTTGNLTVDCGKSPLQYIADTGAFTLTAPSNDGSCILQIEMGSGASTIAFSGFSEGANTGDGLVYTSGDYFQISIVRIHSKAHYLVTALQ